MNVRPGAPEGKTISADRLREVVNSIFQSAGSFPREADLIARHLVEANLRGHNSHGVESFRVMSAAPATATLCSTNRFRSRSTLAACCFAKRDKVPGKRWHMTPWCWELHGRGTSEPAS